MRPDPGRAAPWQQSTRVAVGLATFLAFLLMLRYHDVYWYPPDEGNYAHVAERLTQGEVLHKDVQDVHPGYINFVHAAAFKLFGERLVSLRYPLALLTVLQAGLVAWVLARRGMVVAVAGSVLSVATGVLLFLNPSANWYGLGLTICLVALAANPSKGTGSSAVLTGIVVGVALMFRQLTGVILGIAAVTWLLTHEEDGARGYGTSVYAARAILAVAVAGVTTYALWATDAVGMLLFGVGPITVGVTALVTTRVPDGVVVRRLARFIAGILVGAGPMLAYVAITKSWGGFVGDTVMAAAALPEMEAFSLRSYGAYVVIGILGVATLVPAQVLAGAFWLSLITAPLLLGYVSVRRIWHRGLNRLGGGAIVGLFAGLLMAHFPSPLYVGAAAPAVLLALAITIRPGKLVTVTTCILMTVHVLGWQVGRERRISSIWASQPSEATTRVAGRLGLVIPAQQWQVYRRLLDRVELSTKPGDCIFALPSHAELYFLARRCNPTSFFSLGQGIRTHAEADAMLRAFQVSPPRMVIADPGDQMFTPFALEVIRWAARNARRTDRVGEFWLFEIEPNPAWSRESATHGRTGSVSPPTPSSGT